MTENASDLQIIYFSLNNWCAGENYPDEEPFLTWMDGDFDLQFLDEQWVKENRLCVVCSLYDMSLDLCITATKRWVEENCPKLLTDFKKFLVYPDDNEVPDGFLVYTEENIGVTTTWEYWTDKE